MELSEVIATLTENSDWFSARSVSKAKAYITAANIWLLLAPSSSSQGGASLSLNPTQIEKIKLAAENFVNANDTDSGSNRPRVAFLGVGARE